MSAPHLTESDAADDRDFFLTNKLRHYRARVDAWGRLWIIRRGTGLLTLFRTCPGAAPAHPPPGDDDDLLRAAWVDSAWRDLPETARAPIVRRLKKAEGVS